MLKMRKFMLMGCAVVVIGALWHAKSRGQEKFI